MISNEEHNSEKEDEPVHQSEINDNSNLVNEEVPTSKETNSMTSNKCKTNPWQKRPAKRRCTTTEIADKVTDFHSLKLKLLREEHAARMMFIEKEREFAETEHVLRMDILQKISNSITNHTSSNGPIPIHYENVVENTSDDVYLNNLASMENLLLCKDNLLPL
ncbi:uncharacterized protein LOC124365241 [Homalodisca vitripennis]|uniref:uncharacterized protein LOC124365241 n=1 Tax=Homalodisca vitripennis TaxID=197043 RepID=UPI001EECCC45|nr:uncharacterized protein LOC124365241 [Homalodisca vitripennis]KAG8269284.1 hypothetical protein J6590_004578 [Homalodisca vitripennis]